ncbi:hypothetical protein ACQ4LE_002951 [Meloidogyne hapla]
MRPSVYLIILLNLFFLLVKQHHVVGSEEIYEEDKMDKLWEQPESSQKGSSSIKKQSKKEKQKSKVTGNSGKASRRNLKFSTEVVDVNEFSKCNPKGSKNHGSESLRANHGSDKN